MGRRIGLAPLGNTSRNGASKTVAPDTPHSLRVLAHHISQHSHFPLALGAAITAARRSDTGRLDFAGPKFKKRLCRRRFHLRSVSSDPLLTCAHVGSFPSPGACGGERQAAAFAFVKTVLCNAVLE